jgi:hypothetical protein
VVGLDVMFSYEPQAQAAINSGRRAPGVHLSGSDVDRSLMCHATKFDAAETLIKIQLSLWYYRFLSLSLSIFCATFNFIR